MAVCIGGEGYTLPSGFLLKELCIMHPNNEYSHYLFKTDHCLSLTENDLRTIRYVTEKVNGLLYHDGDIPLKHLREILNRYKDNIIYTYSELMRTTIQQHLPVTVVINVQDMGYTLPRLLPDPHCFRFHCFRYCAKSKAIAIRNFMANQ